MVKLSTNWLTKGLIDYEYKKYILLAYLQKVGKYFDDMKLYPHFSDTLYHYDNLRKIRNSQEELESGFPKKLIGLDMDGSITYENLVVSSEEIDIINKIIEFAIPELSRINIVGKFIYDEVEKCIDIALVGIAPTNIFKGYFIITDHTMDVYEYELTVYGALKTKILNTNLVRSYPNDLTISLNDIKLDLAASSKYNPAVYYVDSPIAYPVSETLLPITKRLLVKKLLQP